MTKFNGTVTRMELYDNFRRWEDAIRKLNDTFILNKKGEDIDMYKIMDHPYLGGYTEEEIDGIFDAIKQAYYDYVHNSVAELYLLREIPKMYIKD
ncbi:MAG: hypothetical protein J6U54_14160 [Clostridiales bacterium]|nr:hypothetical protein [Clostridiales bacterium]